MDIATSAPFMWASPVPLTTLPGPAYTPSRPRVTRKRARSPSTSPELGGSTNALTFRGLSDGTSMGMGLVRSEEEDDVVEPARKRARQAPNPEQERARRVLEEMYLGERSQRPNPNYATPRLDGGIPMTDASIPILHPASVHQPDSSSDGSAGWEGGRDAWLNERHDHDRIRPTKAGNLDQDADMMDADADYEEMPMQRPPAHAFSSDPVIEELPNDVNGTPYWPDSSAAQNGFSTYGRDRTHGSWIGKGKGRAKGKGKERMVYRDYEPEKDCIIVTSLSDTDTSPPSSPRFSSTSPISPTGSSFSSDPIDLSNPTLSPDGIIDIPSDPAHLAQPGQKGFTISPSLLSRLNEWQSNHPDQYLAELTRRRARESDKRGLVVYRHPSGFFGARDPRRKMDDGMDSDADEGADDGRIDLGLGATIEEVEDDDFEGGNQGEASLEDMTMMDSAAMPSLTSEVESMDIE